MAWPIGERFWQELGVGPRTGTVEDGWAGLRWRFPNLRHFGSVDIGYSALGWLGVSFVSTMTFSRDLEGPVLCARPSGPRPTR